MNIYFLEEKKEIRVHIYKPLYKLLEIMDKFNSEMSGVLTCTEAKYIHNGQTQFTISDAIVSNVPKIFEWFNFNCQ